MAKEIAVQDIPLAVYFKTQIFRLLFILSIDTVCHLCQIGVLSKCSASFREPVHILIRIKSWVGCSATCIRPEQPFVRSVWYGLSVLQSTGSGHDVSILYMFTKIRTVFKVTCLVLLQYCSPVNSWSHLIRLFSELIRRLFRADISEVIQKNRRTSYRILDGILPSCPLDSLDIIKF